MPLWMILLHSHPVQEKPQIMQQCKRNASRKPKKSERAFLHLLKATKQEGEKMQSAKSIMSINQMKNLHRHAGKAHLLQLQRQRDKTAPFK